MSQTTQVITIDRDANAAYIRLGREVVSFTEAINDDVNVDLDSSRRVVGVELLSLDAEVPFEALETKYHLQADLVETLKEEWLAS